MHEHAAESFLTHGFAIPPMIAWRLDDQCGADSPVRTPHVIMPNEFVDEVVQVPPTADRVAVEARRDSST